MRLNLIYIQVNHSDFLFYTLFIYMVCPFLKLGSQLIYESLFLEILIFYDFLTCKYSLPTLHSIIKFLYCAVCWKEFLNFDVVRSIVFCLVFSTFEVSPGKLCVLQRDRGRIWHVSIYIFLSNLECFFVHRVSDVGINFIILIMWKSPEFPIVFPIEDEPHEMLSGQQKKEFHG